ncbi:DMT family transporter [Clostridium sp. 'White wine YQ']|uniref:DMT family transporter n=1 Tax=Clostridium sp. 'White wine YQ' TaxID=3027474 RepID=UPI002365FA20|nr:DMT family transporter [Clostridium sp. 'White wine YQ']MDD7795305.1 DMT family transporter [Clostridium sp. 'White wine YQ']
MNNLYATLFGILASIMILFNGTLGNLTGNYTSSVIIHLVGLISICIILLVNKAKFKLQKSTPLYLYCAGVIGVFTVLFNNVSVLNLGVALTLALGLLGQSLTSIIFDHFGFMGTNVVKFEKKKIIGFIIIALGIFIMTVY